MESSFFASYFSRFESKIKKGLRVFSQRLKFLSVQCNSNRLLISVDQDYSIVGKDLSKNTIESSLEQIAERLGYYGIGCEYSDGIIAVDFEELTKYAKQESTGINDNKHIGRMNKLASLIVQVIVDEVSKLLCIKRKKVIVTGSTGWLAQFVTEQIVLDQPNYLNDQEEDDSLCIFDLYVTYNSITPDWIIEENRLKMNLMEPEEIRAGETV